MPEPDIHIDMHEGSVGQPMHPARHIFAVSAILVAIGMIIVLSVK